MNDNIVEERESERSICGWPSWTSLDAECMLEKKSQPALQSSASMIGECHGCQILYGAWKHHEDRHTDLVVDRLCFSCHHEELSLHFFVGASGSQRKVVDLEASTFPNSPKVPHIRTASFIPVDTTLYNVLEQAKSWITACSKLHPHCQKAGRFVPPRLLDVNPPEASSSPDIVHLVRKSDVETLQCQSTGQVTESEFKYLSLSHCWGLIRSKHLTTKETLGRNLDSIPVWELPCTFRDAIEVCRALGVRYLWIDSLCIVQDDNDDWTAHLSAMCDIYAHAFVTIAAGAASDDEQGFFRSGDSHCRDCTSIQFEYGNSACEVFFRHRIEHPDNNWPTGGLPMPLMERGWCFQERLLSARYLCFGPNEILWECNEEVACSCSLAGDIFNPRDPDQEPRFYNCPVMRMKSINIKTSQTAESVVADEWRSLVRMYTCRSLSYTRDKLPALAGLQRIFERRRADECLYGLWRNTLSYDLAWKFYGDDAPRGRSRELPSWSWAATADGRIEWKISNSGDYIKVVQPQAGTFRQLDGSPIRKLKLQGLVLPFSIEVHYPSDSYVEAFPLARRCSVIETVAQRRHSLEQVRADINIPALYSQMTGTVTEAERKRRLSDSECTVASVGPEKDEHRRGDFTADYRFWDSEKELHAIMQNQVKFLFMGESDYKDSWNDIRWINGLVLRPVYNELEQDAVFERIGWLSYTIKEQFRDWKPLGMLRTAFTFI